MKPKAFADGIPVYCAHDKIMPLADLKLNPRNPNHHSEAQIKLGAKIIKGNGWRAPITISNLSGMVTRGHGRILFAQEAGLTSGPIDYQDYENEAAEWADLLADNRLSELSEIDLSEVKDILDSIGDIDIDLTGYDVDDLLADIDTSSSEEILAEPPEDFKEFDENIDTQYCCPKCGYGWSGKPKPNE